MRKGDRKKRDILVSAEKLFCQRGYEHTTIEDILATLHCSKGSFYHHFDSKMQVLEEIAMSRVSACFARFMGEEHPTALKRLDSLLYHCSPFDKMDEDFLSVMLSLSLQGEGAVLRQRIDDARRRLFAKPLEETLLALRAEGTAFFRTDELPMLLLESHLSFGLAAVRTLCDALYTDENAAQKCVSLLHAARLMWQRMLDLPFGQICLVEAEELYDTVRKAHRRLSRYLPGEQWQVQTRLRGLA